MEGHEIPNVREYRVDHRGGRYPRLIIELNDIDLSIDSYMEIWRGDLNHKVSFVYHDTEESADCSADS